MPTSDIRVRNAQGLRVSTPQPISKAAGKSRRRGIAAAKAASSSASPLDALLAALDHQELKATHQFAIQPVGKGAGRRSPTAAQPARSVDIEVDIEQMESAVILVEQDGEFSWHFPESTTVSRAGLRSAARRGLAAATAAPTSVTIPVRMHASSHRAGRGRAGFGIGSVLSAAKGIVLKFVARTAAGAIMQHLERNVRKGIIVLEGDDPTAWRRVETLSDLNLPDEPLRIMLWVHGTFSSTAGAFGALTTTSEGKALLAQAREHYHAIIGFDHPTLSETPLENAIDLVERLGRFERPMHIDAVMHSRGGLVYRSLAELLLPASATKPELGPAVFVGVPNSGTSLAEPANWHTLVDLYTNLAVGAFALLGTIPGGAAPAAVLAEIISGLGALVKYLADVVVTDRAVPGLAAQEPNGEFIRTLNATGVGQPLPDTTYYLAITSNFDPKAAVAGTKPTGLAASFLGRLANGFLDQLFGEDNDLVVNDPSMKRIDPDAGSFIEAALDFGNSPIVYHTVYFAQQQVAQQLRAWLLDEKAREGLATRPGLLTVQPSTHTPFTRIRYHQANQPTHRRAVAAASAAQPKTGRRGVRKGAKGTPAATDTSAAAQQHLEALFGQRHEVGRRGRRGLLTGAPKPTSNYAPMLAHTTTQVSRFGDSHNVHVVSFQQTHRAISIFGTRAVVEVDDKGSLIAAQAKLANVSGVSPEPKLNEKAARERLSATLKLSDDARASVSKQKPSLTFFHDRAADAWHLTYMFTEVPAVPPTTRRPASKKNSAASRERKRDGHGIGMGPRQRFPRFDYLLDANDGSLVYYYSLSPTAAKKKRLKAIPSRVTGVDDEGKTQTFDGLQVGKRYDLHDPSRFIRTHNLDFGDMDTVAVPGDPISSPSPLFSPTDSAGVSAHVNAGHVFHFYNSVLVRRGIDDNGMEVINVVNCTSPADEAPPQWGNAVWYNKKMWYGQMVDPKDPKKRQSLARYLDIIGHELTHGVTEHTCNLVYREEPGALNESFSDIFGVIISNWTKMPTADTRDWDWEIGKGLGDKPGKPLRSMANPKLTGDPAHTKDLLLLAPGEAPSDDNDYGGVHTNSNVHNKAAFNVLTVTVPGAKGKRPPLVFDREDVAKLYYWTLQRLNRVSNFEDVLFTLLDVVRTYYPDPKEQAEKIAAITKAYGDVGIPRPKNVPAAPPAKKKRARTKRK